MKGARIRRIATLGATGLAAMAVVSGGTLIDAAATGGGGPQAQSVLGSGSDTTQFMMHQLDGLYLFSPGCAQIPTPSGPAAWLDFSCQSPDPAGTVATENYAHDQVHEAYFLGSGNGIKQLCQQGLAGVSPIDFARSSRVPGTSDCTGLNFVAYARDGISWEAFDTTTSGVHGMNNQAGTCAGSTGLTQFCLSQSDLQGIFITCAIKNWNQVGGANVPISIYTPQAGSGTRKTWDSFLGGDSSKCIPANLQATHVIDENMNSFIPTTDRDGAIFPFSGGVWKTQVNGQGGAILGAVDNVYPSNSAISSGSFPYSRFLYNVTCVACTTGKQSSPATINYVGPEGWICKTTTNHAINPVTGNNYRTDIAQAIGAAGFVPVLQGVIGGGNTNSDYCRLVTT
jgi:phosphate transport system substrate-binding protein